MTDPDLIVAQDVTINQFPVPDRGHAKVNLDKIHQMILLKQHHALSETRIPQYKPPLHRPSAVTSTTSHAGYENARKAATAYDSDEYTGSTTGDSGCDVRNLLRVQPDELKPKYTALQTVSAEGMIHTTALWMSLCMLFNDHFYLDSTDDDGYTQIL